MQAMTYDEMRQLSGEYDCHISVIGLAAAEAGLALGFFTGGLGFGLALIGTAAALYGVMSNC